MMKRIIRASGALLACFAVAAAQADAPGSVIASFPSPCDYPAGIAAQGDQLFVADWRHAKIHTAKISDGTPGQTFDAPTLNPTGLTFGNGLLWVSDDHTGTIYALNVATGVAEIIFQAPEQSASGLAWHDGELFILAKKRIYRVMPDDGTILGSYDVPSTASRHLAHDGRSLWVSDRVADELYMLEPRAGKVIAILKAPGPHAAGIVAHDDHLWNADFQNRMLNQIVIRGDTAYSVSDPRCSRVEYVWELSNYGPGTVSDIVVHLAIPHDQIQQHLYSQVVFTPQPTQIVHDQWDQPCAKFETPEVGPGEKLTVSYVVDVLLEELNWVIVPDDVGSLEDIPQEIRDAYTADDTRYQYNSPYMQQLVTKIVGDETNPYWIARKIYDHIIDTLHYEMIGGWDIPEVVLKRGSGSCSEYTYSFIALCRAAGIPARYEGSISMRGDDASIDEAFHRWAQIYLPPYGWIPVDANRGDKTSPADQCRGFGNLKNSLLITTQSGGGSDCLHWGYNNHASYKTQGYCNVQQTTYGFWYPRDPRNDPGAPKPENAKTLDQCGTNVE